MGVARVAVAPRLHLDEAFRLTVAAEHGGLRWRSLSGPLSSSVLSFLRERVGDLEQLQILLLLHAESESLWTPEAVASRLRMDDGVTARSLDDLRRNSLVDEAAGGEGRAFRYRPASTALAALVDELATVFAEASFEVMRAMNAIAVERMRTSAMKAFANSFVLGDEGKKKDG